MQAEPSPTRCLCRRSAWSRWIVIRAPVAASGWPIAIAPPSTLVLARSSPSSFSTARYWGANASFTSIRSICSSFIPACCSALRAAGAGPMPMYLGSTPATAHATSRPIGLRPCALANSSLAITVAAAPSTIPEAFPAVTSPYFKKDGLVTAGNASGIVDGAAATVIASEEFAKAHGLKPMGRLVAWAVAGVEPKYMGIGPAPAARKALQQAGMKLEQMDLIEVNEAFAPQYLAVEKELGLDRAKTNVDGGAIAIGHPLAATGARITIHLLHALRRHKQRVGLGSACIGGGQGEAVIGVENYLYATSQLAQTTLRSVLGETELDELLMNREKINNILKNIIDKRTENWGIEVTAVEVKDVDLPPEMKRAMARQAEAERERRAKVINAEGELQASEKLAQAARIIGSEPAAIQLRYLQAVAEIASEKNSP